MISSFDPLEQVRYDLPARRNPNAAQIDAAMPQMIRSLYPFLPEAAVEKYERTHIGYCAGCLFPSGDPVHLEAICTVFTWAFAIDDKFERSNPETIFNIRDTAIPILLGKIPGVDHPLFSVLPVMRERLLVIAGQQWLEERFCKNLSLYFSGLADETYYRNNRIYPTFERYMDVRMRSVNVDIMSNLAEAITARLLPNFLTGHEVIKEIELLVCRVLIFCNDMFSVAEERECGDVLNSILIIEHFEGCSAQQASERVLNMHDKDVERLIELSNNLPDFQGYNPVVQNYVENLVSMIPGYLDWTLYFTDRYTAGGHAATSMQEAVH
ncbi:hypothetical protein MKQ68_18820 [Chitinophaga horti]|uniref:Terpene synthase n=1 Tax=Chitinophaga horti TaxID=2920382 RepID=A0ABY6J1F9_9BACT|nr:hypothetical protein [Chitinophaga horti]UYQ92144.1 hypothetical protein MKQ68_18820 [Chitinophaga horti]